MIHSSSILMFATVVAITLTGTSTGWGNGPIVAASVIEEPVPATVGLEVSIDAEPFCRASRLRCGRRSVDCWQGFMADIWSSLGGSRTSSGTPQIGP